MASVRRLKKNIASVLGELVDTLIIWELVTDKKNEASQAVVEEIYAAYDKYLGIQVKTKGLSTNNCLRISKKKSMLL